MKPELLELLKELADVLEKHAGGLSYKMYDGIYVSVGEGWRDEVCIEWPQNGNVSRLREIIQDNVPAQTPTTGAYADTHINHQST